MTDDIDNDGTTLHESGGVGLRGFPPRILKLLQEVADRNSAPPYGPWEDGEGEPLQDDADAALRWIAACPHSDGWVPIESAPKDGTGIYAFWPPSFGPVHAGCYGVAVFECGHWCNPEDSDDDYTEPTHWQPLPAAPTTEDRSQS